MEKNFDEFKTVIEKNVWSEEKVSEFCDVQKKVYDDFGVKLEPEVIMLGEF